LLSTVVRSLCSDRKVLGSRLEYASTSSIGPPNRRVGRDSVLPDVASPDEPGNRYGDPKVDGVCSREPCRRAEILSDSKQPIVFGDAIGSACRAGLKLICRPWAVFPAEEFCAREQGYDFIADSISMPDREMVPYITGNDSQADEEYECVKRHSQSQVTGLAARRLTDVFVVEG
jgi:hypothetical protein